MRGTNTWRTALAFCSASFFASFSLTSFLNAQRVKVKDISIGVQSRVIGVQHSLHLGKFTCLFSFSLKNHDEANQ